MSQSALIHIIDDDASLRDALDGLFQSVGLETRLYANTQDFVAAKPGDRHGCLVLDVRLPGMSGLDFQDRLSADNIHLPVILMTGHGDIPMTVRAMKAGAVDFLAKPFRDQDMLDAVTAAMARDLEQRQSDDTRRQLRKRFEGMSLREQEVMTLVTAGRMNKQVAADLSISEITVKIHRSAVMKKMAAKTLADLVRMAQMIGVSRAIAQTRA